MTLSSGPCVLEPYSRTGRTPPRPNGVAPPALRLNGISIDHVDVAARYHISPRSSRRDYDGVKRACRRRRFVERSPDERRRQPAQSAAGEHGWRRGLAHRHDGAVARDSAGYGRVHLPPALDGLLFTSDYADLADCVARNAERPRRSSTRHRRLAWTRKSRRAPQSSRQGPATTIFTSADSRERFRQGEPAPTRASANGRTLRRDGNGMWYL